MAYSDSFPATRPVFQADFANGGRIDPRATFSRASTANVWDGSKHESSQNLVLQSQSYDTTWTTQHLASSGALTGSQSAPDGTTTAWLVTAGVQTSGTPILYQPLSGISSSTEYTVSAYLKAGTASHGFISLRGNSGRVAWAEIDFASPLSPTSGGSDFTNISTTSTAVGSSGWYRLTLTCTTSTVVSALTYVGMSDGTNPNNNGYAVWNCNGETIYVWGHQIEQRGSATVYNPTTTQIHREYAPTLQTAAINAPRFEFSATDSASMGLLVEGSSTQLLTYSSDMTNVAWTENGVTASAEAIGPDGTLSAVAVREDTGTSTHLIRQSVTLNGTAATFSVYAKILGNARRLVIREDAQTGSAAVFDLTTGTVASEVAGGTGTITPVGNGWYRCTMLCAPSSGSRLCSFWVVSNTATNYETTTGDGYSGLLLAMPQAEQQSFSSSWISSTSSTVTRAADSASAVASDIGYTGGPVTVLSDTSTDKLSTNNIALVIYSDSNNTATWYSNSTNTRGLYSSGGGRVLDFATTGNGKRAIRLDTNDIAGSLNGAAVVTDSGNALPDLTGASVYFGASNTGSNSIDGHIKRVAIYSEALSDSNLQSLTK